MNYNSIARIAFWLSVKGSIILLFSFAPQSAYGNNSYHLEECYQKAAQRYRVNPYLLKAIAQVESSERANATNVNQHPTKTTEDIGLMQINSIWLPQLKPYGINREKLFNPCLNAHIGAWILAQQIQKYGNTWYAIGAYHSRTPELNSKYSKKVQQKLRNMGAIS